MVNCPWARGPLARSLERKAVMKAGFSEKVVIVTGGAGALGTAVVGLVLMAVRAVLGLLGAAWMLQRPVEEGHAGR